MRTTNERLEHGEILTDANLGGARPACTVCDLRLHTTAEVNSAGLPQQYTRTGTESLEERYFSDYEPDDYGND
jgi:hypothetical protein